MQVILLNFTTCFNTSSAILMEGALGERLKREFNIKFDYNVAMAGLIYNHNSRQALKNIWEQYIEIAKRLKSIP